VYIVTDTRKKVFINVNTYNFWGFDNSVKVNNFGLAVITQPLNALRISLSGNHSYNYRRQDQFVSNTTHHNNTRTIVGEVRQKTLRFTGRVTYNITPDLTLQYYGQPFITRPIYDKFAYVTNPLASRYNDRFHTFDPDQVSLSNGEYVVDENGDGIRDYSFNQPDFNFVQFRSNLIVRWEYKAGSELYLVWSQGNTADALNELDSPLAGSLWNNVFAEQSRNSFLIKCTYRFLR
jgi:hypothetical protein